MVASRTRRERCVKHMVVDIKRGLWCVELNGKVANFKSLCQKITRAEVNQTLLREVGNGDDFNMKGKKDFLLLDDPICYS